MRNSIRERAKKVPAEIKLMVSQMRKQYLSDYYKKNKLPRKAKVLIKIPKERKYFPDLIKEARIKKIVDFIYGK